VPCLLFIRAAELWPSPDTAPPPPTLQAELVKPHRRSYRALPCLSERAAVAVAWTVFWASLIGNVAAVVFTATTGGLAWQS
jgi:hypothetical protein